MAHDPTLRAFIQALPKTETHLHIEGALPYEELLRPLDPKRFEESPRWRQKSYRYPTFPEFEEVLLNHAMVWYTSAERYYESARVIFAKHVAQNVRYVETSFHLPLTLQIGVPGSEIAAAIKAAAPPGLEVRVYTGMFRNSYDTPLRAAIDDLVNWEHLTGVDLHGLESIPTEPWTAKVWKRVEAHGKLTKVHAGELGGADKVREAIEDIGCLRIQHGIRTLEDPAVLKMAVERKATFDVCPLSNVGLRVVPSIAAHPLRTLMKAGIRCTVSTDDPLSFANTLTDEYVALAEEGAYSRQELAQLARNGWEVAQIPEAMRKARLAEIDSVLARS